jgi:hypothetical protein
MMTATHALSETAAITLARRGASSDALAVKTWR